MLKTNHAPTAGLLLITYNQMKLFLDAINIHNSIQTKLGLESNGSYLWLIDQTMLNVNGGEKNSTIHQWSW